MLKVVESVGVVDCAFGGFPGLIAGQVHTVYTSSIRQQSWVVRSDSTPMTTVVQGGRPGQITLALRFQAGSAGVMRSSQL